MFGRRWVYINKNNLIILGIILIIITAICGFLGGMQYQKMQKITFGNGQFNRGNAQFMGKSNGAMGSRPIQGKIVSIDNNTVIVKLNDGSTKIIVVSANTAINKAATGTKDDLKVGENIVAFGTSNTDGSITVQNIQLNPQFRMNANQK